MKNYGARKNKDLARQINVYTALRELKKIDALRNLVSTALTVGALALGILSGPVGITLACLLFLSALYDVYLVRHCNRTINHLGGNNPAS